MTLDPSFLSSETTTGAFVTGLKSGFDPIAEILWNNVLVGWIRKQNRTFPSISNKTQTFFSSSWADLCFIVPWYLVPSHLLIGQQTKTCPTNTQFVCNLCIRVWQILEYILGLEVYCSQTTLNYQDVANIECCCVPMLVVHVLIGHSTICTPRCIQRFRTLCTCVLAIASCIEFYNSRVKRTTTRTT